MEYRRTLVTADGPDVVGRFDVRAHDRRHVTENDTPNPCGHLVRRRHVVDLEHEHGERHRQRRQSHEVYLESTDKRHQLIRSTTYARLAETSCDRPGSEQTASIQSHEVYKVYRCVTSSITSKRIDRSCSCSMKSV